MDISSKIYKSYSCYTFDKQGRFYDIKRNKWLVPHLNDDGYPCITLRNDEGKRKTFKVHRLLAELFIPNPDNKPEVNHKDGDKCNNELSNLEWVTHSENIQHAWDTGLLKSTSTRSAKLSAFHKGRKIGESNHKSRPVRLINTGEIFPAMHQARIKYPSAAPDRISRCCRHQHGYKTAGKHPITKEKLKWEFI